MADARTGFLSRVRGTGGHGGVDRHPVERKRAWSAPRVADLGRWLCICGAALGALGLLGWLTGTMFLVAVVPGLPPMKSNTALGLLLIGIAGSMRRRQDPGRVRRLLSVLAALVVLAIAVGTLAEYALGGDPHIDDLLLHVAVGTYAGRTSPATAVALSLLASSLLLFDFRPAARARPSEWLVVGAAVMAFVGLTGYVFGAARLYRLARAPVIAMSLPSTISLLLTSVGLLLERPTAGLMGVVTARGSGGVMFRRLAVPTILAPVLIGLGLLRLAGALGHAHDPLVIAGLTAVMVPVGLLLLAITAVPLNRTERALRLSEAKSSGILSISADALISIDEDQRITMFNEGAERVFGYAKAEAIGAPLEALIPERFREAHRRHVDRFSRSEQVARHMGERFAPVFGLRKSGAEFPADAAISKLEVGGRKVLTVALRDITEEKRIENELRFLADENARLYQAAGRAVQARDDVLGVVAHDLRSPLGTILMQAALLERREDGARPAARKSGETIARAAKRMNRLIEDLLDVTLLEAGRLSIEPGRVSARQVILDAVESQGPLASSAIELRLDVAPALPDVLADRERILQVLENLVGNALKFTDRGGRVTLGAAPRDGHVLFWIADTGEGIAAEDVPHLFDRFWQARKARRRGAGLGLPIAKGIVEAHGGRIWVESTPGRGSTFFFTIPGPGKVLAL